MSLVWAWAGPTIAGEYFAGYVIEKALSVDNVFVFALIFSHFAVPCATSTACSSGACSGGGRGAREREEGGGVAARRRGRVYFPAVRIATTVVALVLMLVIGLQSCAVYAGGSVLKEDATAQGGALGILLTLLFLVGGAFALGLPTVSLVVFVLAGLLGLLGGLTSGFPDLTIWGVVALVLAVLSYFGRREKRRLLRSRAPRVQ